eukprot:Partr_v1_DN26692_c1_g1_i2_m69113 putative Kinesin family member
MHSTVSDLLSRDFTIAYRIRPSLDAQAQPVTRIAGDNLQLHVNEPVQSWKSETDVKLHTFSGHMVFDQQATGVEIYSSTIEPLLPFAFSGGFLNILAYGQTGSGKTFTLSEISRLAIGHLADKCGNKVQMSLSAVEIYGTSIRDLLSTDTQVETTTVRIAEDVMGKVQLQNATKTALQTPKEFEEALNLAWSSRKTEPTAKNEHSSRSHAIFRFYIQSLTDRNSAVGIVQFIDLAGSERAASDSKSHSADRLKESVFINKTLMTLKDCIRARSNSSPSSMVHIPYRGSKLTLMLKEAFELTSIQPCHTVFIANVSPLLEDVSATINTLRYASALIATPPRQKADDVSPDDVRYWTHEQVLDWLKFKCGSALADPSIVAPYENGMTMSRVPEQDFIARIMQATNGKIGDKRARAIYLDYWNLIVSARTALRKEQSKKVLKRIDKRQDAGQASSFQPDMTAGIYSKGLKYNIMN